jgi:hypothetical protein
MTTKLVGANSITATNGIAKDYFTGTKFTAVASGNMTQFKVYVDSGSGNIKYALYADSAGEPGALITAMNTGQALVPGENILPFTSTPITSGTTYWLMFNVEVNLIYATYNAGSGYQRRYKAATYSSFTFPNPAGSGFGSQTAYYDIIAGWGTEGGATHYASATMSGTGTLAAKGGATRPASATMSGTGSLAATSQVTHKGSATMSGTGSLSAAGTILGAMVYGSATMSGTGTLHASATVYLISPTLLAAQRSPHRLPYVEAKVYDYEQGIKRLTWTRLYDGSETDNHHGIAFDGQGSMHRIRSGGSGTLLYQKITNPGPSSDYSFWTQIATDCAGPCAIAACASKVYIFYRTSTNVLWKYYSHNYGQDWTNAELIATAGVLSMAACWKGTGEIVVCFAATLVKISAVVLNTSDQDTAEYYTYHGLDTTYGMGATYQEGEFPIVLAGKDTDAGTSIVSYALYATKLSDLYAFGALRVLLTADEDVVTAFRYPDCHQPDAAQEYETLQLTVVEDYSGITAYTRPLLAHLVKDTDWSSATITEPRPLFPDPSPYGLRLQSTAGYWWFSTPSGVWRAPRPAADPLDLTPYIQQLHQVIAHQKPGSLVLQLDNSKGYFASPGEGALASLRFRGEIQLRLGYRTTQGPEALDNLTYWIDSWEYTTEPNRSALTLRCVDLWGLASQWAARYSLRWNYTTFQPCRVWEILYQLLGRLGIRLWNNPDAPKSSAIDNYYPKFLSRGGTMADTQLRRLISFVTDELVPRQAICFAKDPLASESSSYEYKNQPGSHPIYAGAYGTKITTSHTQVSGDTADEPPVHVREAAFDWDLLSLGIDNLRMQYDANLEETDQAARRADALLRDSSLRAERGNLVIPTNGSSPSRPITTATRAFTSSGSPWEPPKMGSTLFFPPTQSRYPVQAHRPAWDLAISVPTGRRVKNRVDPILAK